MLPYRNEIPHSVATQTKIYASDAISVVELTMTTPELTEFDALGFALTDQSPLRLSISRRRTEIPSGTFVPINPCQPGAADGFHPVERVNFICIDPAFAEEVEQTLFQRRLLVFPNRPVRISDELRALLAAYVAEAAATLTGSKFLLASCGSALAGCLLRDAACSLVGLEQITVKHVCIKRAIEYLRDNLAADCRLSEVAGSANLSPFHLIRVFKAETGKTPHDYLVDLRIAKAKELLADNNFTIKEVASRCGFQEPGSFSRIFRRKVGATPRDYRVAVSSDHLRNRYALAGLPQASSSRQEDSNPGQRSAASGCYAYLRTFDQRRYATKRLLSIFLVVVAAAALVGCLGGCNLANLIPGMGGGGGGEEAVPPKPTRRPPRLGPTFRSRQVSRSASTIRSALTIRTTSRRTAQRFLRERS